MRSRILIAEDHELVSRGIEQVLRDEFDVAGVVGNGRDALSAALELQPDVVILDVAMPVLNGIEAAHGLRKSVQNAKLLFITQHTDRHYIQAAFKAGGHGYVLKQCAAREIRDAIKAILAGQFYISPSIAEEFSLLTIQRENPCDFLPQELTRREREVLQLVAEGKTAKEIAQHLTISPKTVEFHKKGIMDSLGLRTTAELTRYALENGLIALNSKSTN